MHRARRDWLLFITLLLVASPARGQQAAPPLVIRGGTLIDGTGKPPEQNATILIEAGIIKAVGPEVPVPENARIIEAKGKFILPGMIDASVLLSTSPGNRTLRAEVGIEQRIDSLHALLAAGVTTARLVQGDFDEQRFLRRWAQENLLTSPSLILSGPTFTAPDGHPAEQYSIYAQRVRDREMREVGDADKAREKARELAHTGLELFEAVYDAGPVNNPDPRLSDEALKTLVAEAHGHDLKIFCSVSRASEAATATLLGVDVIEGVWEQELPEEVLAEMAKKKIFFLPSLTQQGDLLNLIDEPALKAYLQEPIVEQSLSSVLRKSLASEGGLLERLRKSLDKKEEIRKLLQQQRERAFENVRRARAASVPLALGTGSGNTLIFPGAAVHRELQLLVKAGLTPMEAIEVATRQTAESLGKAEEVGTIEPGKRADLLILGADPLSDIRNTQKIDWVIQNGRPMRPEEIRPL